MNNQFKEYLKDRNEMSDVVREHPANKDSIVKIMMEADFCMIAIELERLNNILERSLKQK